MTDRDSPEPTGLSEDEVARLLASVGGAEPVPDEVRTRLEETLAALVDERAADDSEEAGSGTAPVVPLRRERRSATGRRLLAAAAVLGVVGLGVGVAGGLVGDLSGGESDSATAGSTGESGDDSGSEAEAEAGAGAGEQDGTVTEEPGGPSRDGGDAEASQDSASDAPEELSAVRGVPEVGTERDLRATVRALAAEPTFLTEGRGALSDQQDRAAAKAGCAAPREGEASTSRVTYRGEDATLVVRVDEEQVEGRVYSCSLGLLLDGVRIPSPSE